MATTRRITANTSTAPARTVHTIKVTLAGSRPPIWRRLQVSSAITLRALHDVFQAAFGWEDYHMWVFENPLGRWGVADRELQINSAAAKRLDQVAPHKADRLGYTYDFGDDWEHTILVEAVTDPEPGIAYPAASPAAAPAHPRTAVASGDTTISSRSSPTLSTKSTRTGWNGSASTQPANLTPQRSTWPGPTARYPGSRPC